MDKGGKRGAPAPHVTEAHAGDRGTCLYLCVCLNNTTILHFESKS